MENTLWSPSSPPKLADGSSLHPSCPSCFLQLHVFNASSLELVIAYQMTAHGHMLDLTMGPFGEVLALMWDPVSGATTLMAPRSPMQQGWPLPGLGSTTAAGGSTQAVHPACAPHGVALGVAPAGLSGADGRMYAAYVALGCAEAGGLQRLVLAPQGWQVRWAQVQARM